MLIGNYSVLNKSPGRWLAGGSTTGTNQAQTRANWNRNGPRRNNALMDGTTAALMLLSYPTGYNGSGWMMPTTAGALSSHRSLDWSASVTGSGNYGRNLASSIPVAIDFTQANMALVVGGVATINVSFNLTPSPNLAGVLGASSSFTGVSFTVNPTLGAKSGLGATIPVTFTVTPTATAKAYLSAIISNEGAAVTPTSVAAEVWGSVAAAFNVAGTMGNKMNSAASAGDPWTTALPGAYGAGSAGQIIGSLQNDINLHTDSAVATQQELLELASFGEQVHVDTLNGVTGTAYPLGTHNHPVDNLADALTIAAANGVGKIHITNELTILASNNIDGLIITSDSWPAVTLNTGVNMENTIFERLSLYGEFEGFWNTLVDCWTYNVTNFSGWVRGGSVGEMALSVGLGLEFGGQVFFDDIVPLFPGVPSIITANTNSEISITGCRDVVRLKSMTTGAVAGIGMAGGGGLIIDSTCTGGAIVVAGIGEVTNESALTIDDAGLASTITAIEASGLTQTGISDAVWNKTLP